MAYLNKPKRKQNPNANHNKNKAQKLVYNTPTWVKLRDYKLRQNPICEQCLLEDRVSPTEEIHHIIPFMTGTYDEQIKWLGFDYSNLKSLCKLCHTKTHNDTE